MSAKEWFAGISKRFGGPVNAGIEFLYADPNQSLANRALDAAASGAGWKGGAVVGAAIGSPVPVVGPGVGAVVGGYLGSRGALDAMNAFQEGVKNLPATRSGGLLGLNEPLINKEAARRFDSGRSSAPPVSSPDVPQKGVQMGFKGPLTAYNSQYAGMSEQEIKDAYDKARYGDSFDQARKAISSGNNPSKFLPSGSDDLRKVEKTGMDMYEYWNKQGGKDIVSSNIGESSDSYRGSTSFDEPRTIRDMFSKPNHINYSGHLQRNDRGSDSFKKDKTSVQGMPTYEDNRRRQKSLRSAQARIKQSAPAPSLNFQSVYSMAKNSGAKFPELVAAQFQLESGGGTSELAQKHNNLFGQKGEGVNYKTLEDGSNGMYAIKDNFMIFNNPQESVNYLVDRWYKDYDQYKGINNASNAYEAAQMLANQGYATDRNYTNKLINILRQQGY